MKEENLGESGRSYMLEGLAQGRGLAEIAGRLISKRGTIRGVVPDGTSAARAKELSVGGLMQKSQSIEWLSKHVRALAEGCLVFQDIWSKPDDLVVRRPHYRSYVVVGECVYYYTLSRKVHYQTIESMLAQTISYLAIGMYLEFGERQIPAVLLKTESAEQLSKRIKEIYLSAYDQESWIVWSAT